MYNYKTNLSPRLYFIDIEREKDKIDFHRRNFRNLSNTCMVTSPSERSKTFSGHLHRRKCHLMVFCHFLPNIRPTVFLSASRESTSRRRCLPSPDIPDRSYLGPGRHLLSAGLLPRRAKENDGAGIWHAVTEHHQVTFPAVELNTEFSLRIH